MKKKQFNDKDLKKDVLSDISDIELDSEDDAKPKKNKGRPSKKSLKDGKIEKKERPVKGKGKHKKKVLYIDLNLILQIYY